MQRGRKAITSLCCHLCSTSLPSSATWHFCVSCPQRVYTRAQFHASRTVLLYLCFTSLQYFSPLQGSPSSQMNPLSNLGLEALHRRGCLLPAVSVHRTFGPSYHFQGTASCSIPVFSVGSLFQQRKPLARCPASPWYQHSFTRDLKFVHPRHWILQWKIKPGDQVVVISGKYKDYRGTVLQIDKMRNGVAVSGVKEQKLVRHQNGTTTRIPGLIHVSNVMLIDQSLGVGTRVALRVDNHGNVVRISKKSGLVIPWPAHEMIKFGDNRRSREVLKSKEERDAELEKELNEDESPDGPKDTPVDVALERTYDYHQDVATMRAMRQMMTKYNRELR